MKTIFPGIRKILPAAVLAMLSLSACAGMGESRSQRIAEKAQQRFASADVNHDGYLSRDEAAQGTPRLGEHFDDIDSDRDGQLSKAEIIAYIKQRRASR